MIAKMCNSFILGTIFLLVFSSYSSSLEQLQISPNKSTLPAISSPFFAYNHLKSKLNSIDSCWRLKRDWHSNRQSLADCAIGFGQGTLGGRRGKIYVVTDPSDDVVNPKPGTLRYGVTRDEPFWIIFARDMVLTFQNVLLINSNKTIDGRGFNIEITGGQCIMMKHVKHVIIHGISVYGCRGGDGSLVQSTPNHKRHTRVPDGDAIRILDSSYVWIDHCYFSNSTDGLIDVTHASKYITISNSRFTNHKKVILLGHEDGYVSDKIIQVTLAFNHFGPGLHERMPRLRYGYVHVANNYYDPWLIYAIGGSSDPTILSEANYFVASTRHKEVTKRELPPHPNEDWKKWRWTSRRDVFINGAFFSPSGIKNGHPPYSQTQNFIVADGSFVPSLTSSAGPLHCVPNMPC